MQNASSFYTLYLYGGAPNERSKKMSAIQNAIEVRNLTKVFSGRVLFENFSLNVKANIIRL